MYKCLLYYVHQKRKHDTSDKNKRQKNHTDYKWLFIARLQFHYGGGKEGFVKAFQFVMGKRPSKRELKQAFASKHYWKALNQILFEMEKLSVIEVAEKCKFTIKFLIESLKKSIADKPEQWNLKMGFDILTEKDEESGAFGALRKPGSNMLPQNPKQIEDGKFEEVKD